MAAPPSVFLGAAAVAVTVEPVVPATAVTVPVSVQMASTPSVFTGAAAVAVTIEPVTAVAPASAAAGSSDLSITLTGAGFEGATGLAFLLNNLPDTDITVTNLVVNAEGTEATATISIASGAAPGARVVQIATPAGSSTVAGTGGNLFTVQ
jgi:hypothetical protein